MEDWDIISPKDVIGSEQLFADKTKSLASAALPFTQSLLSQVSSPFWNQPLKQAFGPYAQNASLPLVSDGANLVQSPASFQLVVRGGDQTF